MPPQVFGVPVAVHMDDDGPCQVSIRSQHYSRYGYHEAESVAFVNAELLTDALARGADVTEQRVRAVAAGQGRRADGWSGRLICSGVLSTPPSPPQA